MTTSGRRTATEVSRLTWALAAIGLVAGLIILGLFRGALNRIASLRTQAVQVQGVARDLLDSFDADRTRVVWRITEMLSGRGERGPEFRGMDRFREQVARHIMEPGDEA